MPKKSAKKQTKRKTETSLVEVIKDFRNETLKHFDETKQYIDEKNKETKQYIDEKSGETKQYTKQYIDEKSEETKQYTKQYIDEKSEETMRHFDVVAEDLKGDIKMLAEQVAANTVKLEEHDKRFDQIDQRLVEIELRLDRVEQRMNGVEDTLEVIKLDLESAKHDLKKKVDWDAFAILEKRVSMIEAKMV